MEQRSASPCSARLGGVITLSCVTSGASVCAASVCGVINTIGAGKLRSQIEEITATGLSLMPDNLETQISKQDLADLLEYLLAVTK